MPLIIRGGGSSPSVVGWSEFTDDTGNVQTEAFNGRISNLAYNAASGWTVTWAAAAGVANTMSTAPKLWIPTADAIDALSFPENVLELLVVVGAIANLNGTSPFNTGVGIFLSNTAFSGGASSILRATSATQTQPATTLGSTTGNTTFSAGLFLGQANRFIPYDKDSNMILSREYFTASVLDASLLSPFGDSGALSVLTEANSRMGLIFPIINATAVQAHLASFRAYYRVVPAPQVLEDVADLVALG